MAPAHQGFETGKPSVRQRQDGLVDQEDVAGLQRRVQIAFQAASDQDRLAQGGVEQHGAPLAMFLGAVERDVGVTQQAVRIVAGAVVDRQTDAEPDPQFHAAGRERAFERGFQRLGAGNRRLAAGGDRHDEFVAAQPGDELPRFQQGGDPLRRRHQHAVADGMAEAVVDQLEAVEIEEQQRQVAPLAVLRRLPVVQPADQIRAVGQPGQEIVGGLMDQPRLVGFAVADVRCGTGQPRHPAVRTRGDDSV